MSADFKGLFQNYRDVDKLIRKIIAEKYFNYQIRNRELCSRNKKRHDILLLKFRLQKTGLNAETKLANN